MLNYQVSSDCSKLCRASPSSPAWTLGTINDSEGKGALYLIGALLQSSENTLPLPRTAFQPHTSNHLWTQSMLSARPHPWAALVAPREEINITLSKPVFERACSLCLYQHETRAEHSKESNLECREQQEPWATLPPKITMITVLSCICTGLQNFQDSLHL